LGHQTLPNFRVGAALARLVPDPLPKERVWLARLVPHLLLVPCNAVVKDEPDAFLHRARCYSTSIRITGYVIKQ
jgi:hypothetical protein